MAGHGVLSLLRSIQIPDNEVIGQDRDHLSVGLLYSPKYPAERDTFQIAVLRKVFREGKALWRMIYYAC